MLQVETAPEELRIVGSSECGVWELGVGSSKLGVEKHGVHLPELLYVFTPNFERTTPSVRAHYKVPETVNRMCLDTGETDHDHS